MASSVDGLPLMYLMRQMGKAVLVPVRAELGRLRLSPPQLAVLFAIDSNPGCSGAQLADEHFVTPQSMGAILAALDKAGLITRHPRPEGGRALEVALTPAGEAALEAVRAVMARAEAELLAVLRPEEQEQLKNLLTRCLAAVQPR